MTSIQVLLICVSRLTQLDKHIRASPRNLSGFTTSVVHLLVQSPQGITTLLLSSLLVIPYRLSRSLYHNVTQHQANSVRRLRLVQWPRNS